MKKSKSDFQWDIFDLIRHPPLHQKKKKRGDEKVKKNDVMPLMVAVFRNSSLRKTMSEISGNQWIPLS